MAAKRVIIGDQEIQIPDIDDLIDEKENKFNDGWW